VVPNAARGGVPKAASAATDEDEDTEVAPKSFSVFNEETMTIADIAYHNFILDPHDTVSLLKAFNLLVTHPLNKRVFPQALTEEQLNKLVAETVSDCETRKKIEKMQLVTIAAEAGNMSKMSGRYSLYLLKSLLSSTVCIQIKMETEVSGPYSANMKFFFPWKIEELLIVCLSLVNVWVML
jgi:hypothetical protein